MLVRTHGEIFNPYSSSYPKLYRSSHKFDLPEQAPIFLRAVLLDYHMPGMNGDVVAEHMKAGQPDVPIALRSADDGLPQSALKWVDAFVSKSESPANLLQIVEVLLDLRFRFAPLDLAGGAGRRAA
jgi:CheY-like chemotaxis protein